MMHGATNIKYFHNGSLTGVSS